MWKIGLYFTLCMAIWAFIPEWWRSFRRTRTYMRHRRILKPLYKILSGLAVALFLSSIPIAIIWAIFTISEGMSR